MYTLAILTATYNRAHLLSHLYQSILNQQAHPFKITWYIIDDGSTDDTSKIVQQWQAENKCTIKYQYRVNGGKMAAINSITPYIKETYMIEIDSDDLLINDALQKMSAYLDQLNDSTIGLVMNSVNMDKTIVGYGPSEPTINNMIGFYYEGILEGDKKLLFLSHIRKQYHYKLSHGERFSTEGRMHHQMAIDGYQMLYIPVNAIECEYLDDGYSKNIKKLFIENPWTHYYYYIELLNYKPHISFKVRFHLIRQLILFTYLTKQNYRLVNKQIQTLKDKCLFTIFYIPGLIKSKQYKNNN